MSLRWNTVVLCSRIMGGAEIFALSRMAQSGSEAVLICNPELARLVRGDGSTSGIRLEVVDALEPLAGRVTLAHARYAARSVADRLAGGDAILGNLRAASLQLFSPHHLRNDCFVHDNTHYLNAKARWLLTAIVARSRTVYFPCHHSMARLPLRRLLDRRLAVEYFAAVGATAPRRPQVAEALRIATVGRIGPDKNQALAVDIASALSRRVGRVDLTLLGDVFEPEYYASIRARADGTLRIAQHKLPHAEMADCLARQHLVLHSSRIESLPLVLFEANAAGIPFFALPAGGIPEVLDASYLLSEDADEAATRIATFLAADDRQPAVAAR